MHRLSTYIIIAVAVCLVACGNSRQRRMDKYRSEKRVEFYDDKLEEAQQELAATDSLLQRAEEEGDSFDVDQRIYMDSLDRASQVQGAKIRYIHRKQKEIETGKVKK